MEHRLKTFLFSDAMGRKFKVMELSGEPWLLFWNEVYKSYTTLRRLSPEEVDKFAQVATAQLQQPAEEG